jgi:MFS family permease
VTDGIFAAERRTASVGIIGLVSLVAFEAMAVATALPTAVRALDGLAWYGWSFTALLVSSVVGMVAAGEAADRVGARLPLFAGVLTFLAGLLVAGTATTMPVFLLGRALQGLGGGQLAVVLYVIVGEYYPQRLRPAAFGAISAAWVVPALVGPVVAGALAEGPGWRWVFLGLVPLVLAASGLLVPAARRLTRPRDPAPPQPARRFAALAAAAGVATVQWSLQEPSRSPLALAGPALLGLVLLGLGLRVLLPAGTVALRRGVPAVVAMRGLLAGAFFSMESLVPLTLTLVHGFSATTAGLPLTVGALGWAAASWWQGRYPGLPRHRLVGLGALLVAVAAGGMAVVAQPWAPGWAVYAVWVVGTVGMGLAMASIGVLLLALSPVAERGANTSALQISDSVASALCIGFGGVLVAASERGVFGLSTATATLSLSMLALALLGAVASGRVREPVASR